MCVSPTPFLCPSLFFSLSPFEYISLWPNLFRYTPPLNYVLGVCPCVCVSIYLQYIGIHIANLLKGVLLAGFQYDKSYPLDMSLSLSGFWGGGMIRSLGEILSPIRLCRISMRFRRIYNSNLNLKLKTILGLVAYYFIQK